VQPGVESGTVGLLNFAGEVSEAKGIADLVEWLKQVKEIPLSKSYLSRTDYRGTFTKRIKNELIRRTLPYFDSARLKESLGETQNRKTSGLFSTCCQLP